MAFPEQEAWPRPPFQPHSRQDSLGVAWAPAQLLRSSQPYLVASAAAPSAPPRTPRPRLHTHPRRRDRDVLWRRGLGKRREKGATGGGQDRKMEGHPAGLRGDVGKEEEERGWEWEGDFMISRDSRTKRGRAQCEGIGAQDVGPRSLSDRLGEAPQPRAQPPGNLSPSVHLEPHGYVPGCPTRRAQGQAGPSAPAGVELPTAY